MRGSLLPLGAALLLLLPLSGARAQTDLALQLREPGVLYFEDNLPDKITVKLKAPLTVYLGSDFQMAAAYMGPGQQVELVGMNPDGYLVKGTYRNNTVRGWIKPEDLPSGVDPTLLAEAKKNQARHDAIAVAIANKSVIPGMTPDEVKQALGRPVQTSSKTDASGTELTMVFATYRLEPQNNYVIDQFGRPLLQTYYVKVPIGQLIVNFDNDAVTSVEEHKTDPNTPGVVTN